MSHSLCTGVGGGPKFVLLRHMKILSAALAVTLHDVGG